MLDPSIGDGTGVAAAMAKIVGGGAWVANAVVVMLMLSILLIVMTSMMEPSRTLYQASVDGWLPKYLSHVNEHGSPTRAMWTDLGFNLVLLMMSDYMTVLSISNVCYMLFVFLNLQSGWIHRMDRGNWDRPFRCPTWLLVGGAICGYARPGVCRCGRPCRGEGHAAQRADRDAADRAGVPVPSLLAGSRPVPRADAARHGLEVPKRAMWLNLMPYVALVGAGLTIWLSYYFAWVK